MRRTGRTGGPTTRDGGDDTTTPQSGQDFFPPPEEEIQMQQEDSDSDSEDTLAYTEEGLPSEVLPPPTLRWRIVSANIGPAGLTRSWESIAQIIKSLPAVVMLQDVKVSLRRLTQVREQAERLFPAYRMFINPVTRPWVLPVQNVSKIQRSTLAVAGVATLIHRGWAHRAAIYDKKNLANSSSVPLQLDNILVLRHEDPFTGVKGLWMNVYNDTSSHPERQDQTLKSVQAIIEYNRDKFDFVIAAGDWNASLHPRGHGLWGTPPPAPDSAADRRFREWTQAIAVHTLSSGRWTFRRFMPNEVRSTIDYIFWTGKSTPALTDICAEEEWSFDPVHDHRVVSVTLSGQQWSPLPALFEMTRKVRINNNLWGEKGDQWKDALSTRLSSLDSVADDPFAQLEGAVKIAAEVGCSCFGVTGARKGKALVQPRLRLPSPEERKLTRHLRTLRIALSNIHSRSSARKEITKAMSVLLDSGCIPSSEPHSFRANPSAPEFSEWVSQWKSHIRVHITETRNSLYQLTREIASLELAVTRSKAQERMNTPGSKEIRRWVGKYSAPISAVYLRSEHPDMLIIPNDAVRTSTIQACQRYGISVESALTHTIIRHIPIQHMVHLLQCQRHSACEVKCTQAGRLVSEDTDKLAAWEFFLASEALSTRSGCPLCEGRHIIPIVEVLAKDRSIRYWCHCCGQFISSSFTHHQPRSKVHSPSKSLPANLSSDEGL